MSRAAIIKEIRELLNDNLSEWVDIKDIIIKYAESEQNKSGVNRQHIKGILEEMRAHGDIQFYDPEAGNALSIRMQGKYPTDSLRIRTTLKYDKEQEEKNKPKENSVTITNYGTISNSPIGNNQSDLSDAFANPLSNIDNTINEQDKKRPSLVERLAWIATILAFVITILAYFKIWPFNK